MRMKRKLISLCIILALLITPVQAVEWGGSSDNSWGWGGESWDWGSTFGFGDWFTLGTGATGFGTETFGSGNGVLIDQPARWNPLTRQVILRGSPDGTVVYPNIYAQCDDPDSFEFITVASTHTKFSLYFDNNDLKIRNLDPTDQSVHRIVLDCNGVQEGFDLWVTTNPTNQLPIANAGPDRTVDVNDFVTFDGSQSTGDIVSYTWNFGDGTLQQQGQTVVHQFTSFRTFTVTLTVTDQAGATASDTAVIIANGRPTAVLICPSTAQVNQLVSLDATQSTDNGRIVQYAFEFGDSTSSTGASARVDHTYTQSGTFTARVTVTDDDSITHSATCSIVITALPGNQAPIANAGPDRTVDVNDLVTFDGSGSRDTDGAIAVYEWDFGDGSPKERTQITRHQFTRLSTFTVTLTVTDNQGATGTDTAVVIANGRPTAVLICPATIRTSMPVTFDARQSTDDTRIVSYNFTFGDGTSLKGTEPVVQHAYSREGAFIVTLTVTDDDGITHQASCTVTSAGSPQKIRTPRDRLIFSNVHFNEEVARAGDVIELSVTLENDGKKDLEEMRVTLYNYDLDVRETSGVFEIDAGDKARRTFHVEIPENTRPGVYDIQITASNDKTKHETFRTITIR